MKVVNLTPHTINEVTTGTSYPPSGQVARVAQVTVKAGEHDGVPMYKSTFGKVEGLPEPEEGTIYIVSAMALNGVVGRDDVVSPGNLERDENGQPVGCVGFRMNNN